MVVRSPTKLDGTARVGHTSGRTKCGATVARLRLGANPIDGIAKVGLAPIHIALVEEIDAVLAIHHHLVRFVVAPH